MSDIENNIIPINPHIQNTVSYETRQDILNNEITQWVAKGWNIQTINGTQAILHKPKRIGFFWNFILTLLTGGLWLFIWLYKILNQKTYQVIINVNEYGEITYPL